MGYVLRALPLGDLHLAAGDAGPGHRGAQQVPVLVDGVGLDRRPDELLHELPLQVLDEDLGQREGAALRIDCVHLLIS